LAIIQYYYLNLTMTLGLQLLFKF